VPGGIDLRPAAEYLLIPPGPTEDAVEVQTFFLALEVQRRGRGDYTAITPCVSQFAPPDGRFPFDARLPYLLLLRRASRGAEQPVALRFNLIDEDGRPAGKPADFRATGHFPAGHGWLLLSGHILFSFPEPGEYRLDITADDLAGDLYSYEIEIGTGPSP
jgi:hypothetical protein